MDKFLASTKTCADTKFSYVYSGTMVIELREFNDKKNYGQNAKIQFCYNLAQKW